MRPATSITRRISSHTLRCYYKPSHRHENHLRSALPARKYIAYHCAVRGQTPSLTTPNPVSVYERNNSEVETTTIYALSTAPGRAGIAIIRISGSACRAIYCLLCPGQPALVPRVATIRTLYEPHRQRSPKNILDKHALLISFQGNGSATGEEILELHIHGGNATVKAVLNAIPRCKSFVTQQTIGPIRHAEPGEFTRRAFQNNRLDLAQVEALSDALSADTEMQRRAAVIGSSGLLGRQYEVWRQMLLEARGELEAIIDFSEDQDFDMSNTVLLKNIEAQITPMLADIEQYEEGSRRAELLRKGIRISLLGAPNAGKSSLLNRIVGREASIVSTEAGTTRDIVEVSVDIEGYLCTFADTAGLRSAIIGPVQGNTNDSTIIGSSKRIGPVEQEGIRRAKEKARESDFVIAFTSVEQISGDYQIQYDLEALEIASRAQRFIIVVNKMDLVPEEKFTGLLSEFRSSATARRLTIDPLDIVAISCKPKDAMDSTSKTAPGNIRDLITVLARSFKDMTTVNQYDHIGITSRQQQLLEGCREHCGEYLLETQKNGQGDESFDIVVAAEHLRSAATCLSRITGRGEGGDVEEVLGVVFEKFCVGK